MAKITASLPALKLSFSLGKDLSEDRMVTAKRGGVRLLAAFDGCGGVGARRYPQLNNHTGAYLAAGLYADCLSTWFLQHASGLPQADAAGALSALFLQTAAQYNAQYLEAQPSAVTGSMVRTLPSTAAIALLYGDTATVLWAGNTRAYLLTDRGLRQLTQDDLASQCSAFDSLYTDAPITNYLCADRPFALHEATVTLPGQGVFVLATDGAFHALPTPMHLEALLLDTMRQAESKKHWKKLLKEQLADRAADDVTLILQPLGFTTLPEMQAHFDKRRRHVRQAYILPADQAERESLTALKALWDLYQRE